MHRSRLFLALFLAAAALAMLLQPPVAHAADPSTDDPSADDRSIVIDADATVTDSLLDRYTDERDDSFAWTLAQKYVGPGVQGYAIDLTSQTWRADGEVSHPAWTHMMQVIVPVLPGGAAPPDTAMLFITGGTRRDTPPRIMSLQFARLAQMTGTVVVLLPNVPNQPLVLNGDGERRYEDDLLAESWITAGAQGDAGWIVHLAMVESAVAAMDAAQAFLASDEGGNIGITGFVVSGASKRGWTSWLTAAVDERVRGVIPLVIDVMNLPKMIEHHWGAYGFWAPAIGDYAGRELFRWLGSPEARTLREVVDPYLYRDRLTMPKFILNAAGDEYFLPDTTRYFLDDLPGETRLRIVPNADHSVDESMDAVMSALGFYAAVVRGLDIPALAWERPEAGTLRVTADTAPVQVTLWQAVNPAARDFRREEVGDIWEPTPLEANELGEYTATVGVPESGFRAFFVEARFAVPGLPLPLVFTTEVAVVPDVLPHRDKAME
jgi:PhoPQ-activated pathogenicity-related protein